MYTTPQALIDHFKAAEVTQLADPDHDSMVATELMILTVEGGDRSAYSADEISAADAALVNLERACESAFKESNSYIAPRYTLPLSESQIDNSPLEQHNADIARYRLAEDRATEEIEKRYTRAIAWLRDVQKGMASLGEGDAVTAKTGRMVSAQGVSAIDWESY